MGRVLVAFFAGLGVAVLAFSIFDDVPECASSESSRGTPSRQSVETSATSESPRGTPSLQSVETSDTDDESGSRNLIPDQFAADSGLSEVEDQSISAAERALRERPPVELPIILPPEFDWLSEGAGLFNTHHTLEREPIDYNWAPAMEAQISRSLLESPEITQTYGHPTITCRTTMCELAFVAHGVDTSTDTARGEVVRHFSRLATDILEQPPYEQFLFRTTPMTTHRTTEDGVTTIIWALVTE